MDTPTEDLTEGKRIGDYADDPTRTTNNDGQEPAGDATQGRGREEDPYADPTRGRSTGSASEEDPTRGRTSGALPGEDATQTR